MEEKNIKNIKKKISKKDQIRKNYLEELELLKQYYGVEFDIDSLENEAINKIKFYKFDYKKSIKNVVLIYDNKTSNFNYISYEYDSEKDIKNLTNHKIIEDLNSQKKLEIIVNEINKINAEYRLKLQNLDNKINEKDELILKSKELKKKDEN